MSGVLFILEKNKRDNYFHRKGEVDKIEEGEELLTVAYFVSLNPRNIKI